MDWSSERYVRAYIRDTADYLVLSWQARGLWWEILRKADRSGVVACSHGSRGIAVLVRWPAEVVAIALAELVEDGCIQVCHDGYLIPNYLEAQEAVKSNALRCEEYRERRRDERNTNSVKANSNGVGNDTSKHAATRGDTPSRSEPILADPIRAEPLDAVMGFDFGQTATATEPPKAARKDRATKLDDAWSPGPVVVPDGVDISVELERFRDWARANGRKFVDWQAAWRNWVRKAGELAPGTRGKPVESGLQAAIRIARGG